MRRAMQFMTMDQLPDLRVYELALESGGPCSACASTTPSNGAPPSDLIRRRGGHFINRFGAWATEEIAPRRGEMPKLPQYMQR